MAAGDASCMLTWVPCWCVGGAQADVYERLDALDSDTTEARAASILHGLGFNKEMQVGAAEAHGMQPRWLTVEGALDCSWWGRW